MATGGRLDEILEGQTLLGRTPAELLGRFAAARDEAAFAALVARHGPMVLATCRRLLSDPHDADDAFQATFLVLARRAGAVGDPDRLAPWLHGVARKVAARSRSLAARRRRVEGGGDVAIHAVAPPADRGDALDLRPILDEELARLPARQRDPIVLCHLDGLTHDEAAARLGWPVGTVRSRLARGRDRLRSRLARRGLGPADAALLAAITPPAAVPPALGSAAVRLASAAPPVAAATPAALLAQGVLTSMLATKLQIAGLAAAALALGTAGLAAGTQFGGMGQGPPAQASPPAEPKPADPPGGATPRADPPGGAAAPAPDPVARLEKELEAARARVQALEAELAALRPSTGPMGAAKKTAASTAKGRVAGGGMMSSMGPMMGGHPMGMGVMPGGRGGGMGIASSPLTLGDSKALIIPPEQNRVMAVDTVVGTKVTFRPTGEVARISLIASNRLVGLALEGPRITQTAAYSIPENRWYPVDLREPVEDGVISPVVAADSIQFGVGRCLYMFSGQAKRWGVLELKRAGGHATYDGNAAAMVTEDDTLHVFNQATGEWSHIDIRDEATPTPPPAADPGTPKPKP